MPINGARQDFYRTRGNNQTIQLNRRNDAQSPTGSFCCELPDTSDVTHRLCATLGKLKSVITSIYYYYFCGIDFLILSYTVPISITPSGINTAGEQYNLTCKFLSSTGNMFTLWWSGPPNDTILPSGELGDTRMVSDVMSSGSTHTSILQFDPLQSSHEGNYTCEVTVVSAAMHMSSFRVIVDTPVP